MSRLRPLLACLLGLLGGVSGRAQSTAADELAVALAELDGPVTVQARVGRDFTGHPASVRPDQLVLRVEVGEGDAEYQFSPDDVLRIRFPGNSLKQRALELAAAGDLSAALGLVDRLFAQRSPFFGFNGGLEADYFAETLGLYRQAGRTYEALARAEVIRPFVTDPERIAQIEKEQLLGYHTLGLADRARPLAAAWIAREGRVPESALGALVLAQLQVAARDGDGALFTLLHPIVFSGARPIEYLDLCYDFAIRLARVLDDAETAARLERERTARGLTPPATWNPLPEPDFSSLTSLQPPS